MHARKEGQTLTMSDYPGFRVRPCSCMLVDQPYRTICFPYSCRQGEPVRYEYPEVQLPVGSLLTRTRPAFVIMDPVNREPNARGFPIRQDVGVCLSRQQVQWIAADVPIPPMTENIFQYVPRRFNKESPFSVTLRLDHPLPSPDFTTLPSYPEPLAVALAVPQGDLEELDVKQHLGAPYLGIPAPDPRIRTFVYSKGRFGYRVPEPLYTSHTSEAYALWLLRNAPRKSPFKGFVQNYRSGGTMWNLNGDVAMANGLLCVRANVLVDPSRAHSVVMPRMITSLGATSVSDEADSPGDFESIREGLVDLSIATRGQVVAKTEGASRGLNLFPERVKATLALYLSGIHYRHEFYVHEEECFASCLNGGRMPSVIVGRDLLDRIGDLEVDPAHHRVTIYDTAHMITHVYDYDVQSTLPILVGHRGPAKFSSAFVAPTSRKDHCPVLFPPLRGQGDLRGPLPRQLPASLRESEHELWLCVLRSHVPDDWEALRFYLRACSLYKDAIPFCEQMVRPLEALDEGTGGPLVLTVEARDALRAIRQTVKRVLHEQGRPRLRDLWDRAHPRPDYELDAGYWVCTLEPWW